MAESRFLENVLPCANTLSCVFNVAHGKHVTFAVELCVAASISSNLVKGSSKSSAGLPSGSLLDLLVETGLILVLPLLLFLLLPAPKFQ